MALTKNFRETIQERAQCDPEFRSAMLEEGIQCFLAGDIGTGRSVLRDYINATIGFDELAVLTDKSSKSLMRMFGPQGNPKANNLFEIIRHLQAKEGVELEVHTRRSL